MRFIVKVGSDSPAEEPSIPEEDLPLLLYHYCTMESFLAIIQSKRIRLSNSFILNDSRENTWINNYINQAISDFKTNETEKFVDGFIELYNGYKFTPYVSCFSKDGDSLSQWRAYSNDATGVAIGFKPKSTSPHVE